MAESSALMKDPGVCVGTLVADPRALDAETMERALRAAAGAGFISVSIGPAWAETLGVDRLGSLLRQSGLKVRAIEAIVGWSRGAEAAREETRQRLALAAEVGADILMAATIEKTLDRRQAVEGLAAACSLAAEQNVRVALEFIPGTAVPDLACAWELIGEVGAPNAGVVVDALHWHHQPGGPDLQLLRSIPPQRIHYVQLCDAPAGASPSSEEYLAYAMTARALPGEGVVEIDAILAALEEMGASPYFAAEVFNSELAATGADVMAGKVYRAVVNTLG